MSQHRNPKRITVGELQKALSALSSDAQIEFMTAFGGVDLRVWEIWETEAGLKVSFVPFDEDLSEEEE